MRDPPYEANQTTFPIRRTCPKRPELSSYEMELRTHLTKLHVPDLKEIISKLMLKPQTKKTNIITQIEDKFKSMASTGRSSIKSSLLFSVLNVKGLLESIKAPDF